MYRIFNLLILSFSCLSGKEIGLDYHKLSDVCGNYPSSNLGDALLDVYFDKEVTSKVNLCVQSEPFLLSRGVVQTNIFMKSVSKEDALTIFVYKKSFDRLDIVAAKEVPASDLGVGWQMMDLDVPGEYWHGYVSLHLYKNMLQGLFTFNG